MKKLFFLIFIYSSLTIYSQTTFHHVLITNDDGIEDADRLIALAKSVSEVADRVSIIVSEFDRSGFSNHSSFGKYKSVFEITCEYYDKENNIAIYTIPGNPADCVILGLGGFFGEDTPDLVLSGINSGANIGAGWFGSGTIGAIRTAAFCGAKGIALSGFDDDNEESFSIIPQWIKEFLSSGFINELDNGSYLTIGFPRISFEEIKGIKLVSRRIIYDNPEVFHLKKIYGEEPYDVDNKTIWTAEVTGNPYNSEIKYDNDYLAEGYIIITPMSIDENNDVLLNNLKKIEKIIPDF